MYQVKIKATPPKGYKAHIYKGIFIPKGKSCKKEKIEAQCHELIRAAVKGQHGIDIELCTLEIKRINNDFVCREDK